MKGKGSVFYVGENQHREMTGRHYHTSLHAEMNALFKSIKSLDKCNRFLRKKKYCRPAMTIYVVRLLRDTANFLFGCSKPCSHCQKYLAIYNVKRIRYTDIINNVSVLCELRLK